jgi:hypothetical protein
MLRVILHGMGECTTNVRMVAEHECDGYYHSTAIMEHSVTSHSFTLAPVFLLLSTRWSSLLAETTTTDRGEGVCNLSARRYHTA